MVWRGGHPHPASMLLGRATQRAARYASRTCMAGTLNFAPNAGQFTPGCWTLGARAQAWSGCPARRRSCLSVQGVLAAWTAPQPGSSYGPCDARRTARQHRWLRAWTSAAGSQAAQSAAADPLLVELSGTVAKVVFKSDSNGYTIVKLAGTDKGLVTVAGTMPQVGRGANGEATGRGGRRAMPAGSA